MNIRKINKAGSITIPTKVRRELGITCGDTFKMETDEKGILFTRHYGHCIFCNSESDIEYFNQRALCKDCRGKIKEVN